MQVSRKVLATVSELPATMLPDADLALGLKKGMVHLLQQLHCKYEPAEDLVTSPCWQEGQEGC